MDKLKEMLEFQADQPCSRYDDITCISTDDCLTEYCWPCYGKVMFQELQRHLTTKKCCALCGNSRKVEGKWCCGIDVDLRVVKEITDNIARHRKEQKKFTKPRYDEVYYKGQKELLDND